MKLKQQVVYMISNYFQMIIFFLAVWFDHIQKMSMCFYDVIVELMNIHEIKCKISNQAISGTSHDNLVRFAAFSSFHQFLLQFYKTQTFSYDL